MPNVNRRMPNSPTFMSRLLNRKIGRRKSSIQNNSVNQIKQEKARGMVNEFISFGSKQTFNECEFILKQLQEQRTEWNHDFETFLDDTDYLIAEFKTKVNTILKNPDTSYNIETLLNVKPESLDIVPLARTVIAQKKDEIGSSIVKYLKSKLESLKDPDLKKTYKTYCKEFMDGLQLKKHRKSDIGVLEVFYVNNGENERHLNNL